MQNKRKRDGSSHMSSAVMSGAIFGCLCFCLYIYITFLFYIHIYIYIVSVLVVWIFRK